MTEITDQDRALVVIADAYVKELSKRVKAAKEKLGLELDEGQTQTVSYDLDGQELRLGKVQRTKPEHVWRVTDPDALLAWAREAMPDLVDLKPVLDMDGVDELLEKVRRQNGAFTDAGEVIPGITYGPASSSYTKIVPDRKHLAESLRILSVEGKLEDVVFQFRELEG